MGVMDELYEIDGWLRDQPGRSLSIRYATDPRDGHVYRTVGATNVGEQHTAHQSHITTPLDIALAELNHGLPRP